MYCVCISTRYAQSTYCILERSYSVFTTITTTTTNCCTREREREKGEMGFIDCISALSSCLRHHKMNFGNKQEAKIKQNKNKQLTNPFCFFSVIANVSMIFSSLSHRHRITTVVRELLCLSCCCCVDVSRLPTSIVRFILLRFFPRSCRGRDPLTDCR